MHRLLKFWSLSLRDKKFFFEASILLLLSSLSVRLIAFRHIHRFLRARWNNRSRTMSDSAEDIKLINLSVLRATHLLPWKTLCLSESIAIFMMLRRRGVPATIVAGVKVSEESTLHAHAWVETQRSITEVNSDNSEFTVVVRIGEESPV